jgi:hypothetical protein
MVMEILQKAKRNYKTIPVQVVLQIGQKQKHKKTKLVHVFGIWEKKKKKMWPYDFIVLKSHKSSSRKEDHMSSMF